MYRIIVHRWAARYLQRLPRPQRERIRTSLSDLASEPIHRPGMRPMLGEWTGYYRMRVGDTRLIFWVVEQEMTVYVDHIGPRGDVYK